MNRIVSLLLIAAFMLCLAASCGKAEPLSESSSQTERPAASTPATESATSSVSPPETEPSTTPEQSQEEGLLLHLTFDAIENGTIRDMSGNGHDAVLSGDPQITENGRENGGIRFTEAGQYLTVADAEGLNFTENDSFTVEISYRWLGFTPEASWPCLFQKGLSASENAYRYVGLWINSSNRVLNLGLTGVGGTQTQNLSSSLTVDTLWHTAVIIQDAEAGTITLYIDGSFRGTSAAIDACSPGHDLYIGSNGIDGQFFGTLDNLKIYSYAKDPDSYERTLTGTASMLADSITYTDPDSGESVTLPYRVYYPTDYDPDDGKTYPMLFFLHGFGECGTDNMKQLSISGLSNELLDNVAETDRCIIVAPQCQANPASLNWIPIQQQWSIGSRELTEKPTISLAAATALLYEFLESGKVDTDRVYASGVSMGGYGTWELLTRHPEVFAAAIPVCGAGIPSMADRLVDIAIWAFHGEADKTVPVSGTRDMEAAIKATGGTNIQATYFPGVAHNSWVPAYATDGLVDWLFAQSKSR